VDLAPELRTVLEECRRSGRFVAVRGRKVWGVNALTQAIRTHGSGIDLPKLNGPQILRRTFACHLVSAGRSLAYSTSQLGDTMKGTEERYARSIRKRRGNR